MATSSAPVVATVMLNTYYRLGAATLKTHEARNKARNNFKIMGKYNWYICRVYGSSNGIYDFPWNEDMKRLIFHNPFSISHWLWEFRVVLLEQK